MRYDVASKKMESLGWTRTEGRPAALVQLELLASLEKSGAPLPDDWPAIWSALCDEVRYQADYYEAEVIRRVRMNLPPKLRPTWLETAGTLDNGVTSKQGMAQRWRRLISAVQTRIASRAHG